MNIYWAPTVFLTLVGTKDTAVDKTGENPCLVSSNHKGEGLKKEVSKIFNPTILWSEFLIVGIREFDSKTSVIWECSSLYD